MFENLKENLSNLVYNKKFLIILVVAAIFTGVAFYYYNSYVAPRMDPKFATNKEFIAKGDEDDVDEVEVYYFYTTWCPYCKKARPAWDAIKDTHKNVNGKAVIFKEVDCEKDEKKADEFGIEGYPTIKLVKGNEVIDFDAKPSKESLKQFLKTSV